MPKQDPRFVRRAARLAEFLRKKGISDEAILEAVAKIPRNRFVEKGLEHRAFEDEALPIGLQQTISQPYTVAYQTSLLELSVGDRVLEVGTGSGYQAAVLLEVGARVFTIERHEPLFRRTRALMEELGYHMASTCGDGYAGWEMYAPFDAILVTAAAPNIPEALKEQLKQPDKSTSGGRLVIPVGGPQGQTMYRLTRLGPDTYREEQFDDFRFVPLVSDS